MTDIDRIREALSLGEESDIEFKLAHGPDGKGKLPASFWESYSAMANAEGGAIVLGVRETDVGFVVAGLENPDRVQVEVFDGANNRQIVSRNLLSSESAHIEPLEGHSVLVVSIPRAGRSDRPIFVGEDMMRGTFRRGFRGDYHCDDLAVKRMLAEALEESRDTKVLPKFSTADLDLDTVARFRADLQHAKPTHPFLEKEGDEFLLELGVLGRDREAGVQGVTLAGLLMFGRLRSIREYFQFYFLDYQERAGEGGPADIVFRNATDGSWSGNLYDFYLRTLPRLVADVKIPVKGGSKGKSAAAQQLREALSEALVNTMIHADYSCRTPVLITRREGMFVFRNPGGLRLPIRTVLEGGTSDCRNRTLQTMFVLTGAAEHAGSGIPVLGNGFTDGGSSHAGP
ncbi:MAG: putative DNA binding domain-containing protein, partial [Thermoplasmata archaeon]|nr:putative DNA binding domain-containing protein [Thermoplasmata archaeon]